MTRKAVVVTAVLAAGFAVTGTVARGQRGTAPAIPNLAGKILTVAGPIDPSAAGQTLMHEHIFIDFKAPPAMMPPPTGISVLKPAQPASAPPPAPAPGGRAGRGGGGGGGGLTDYDESLAEIMEFKKIGGGTIVDVTNFGLTRDPEALLRVSKASGLNVVMGAGWYQKALHPPDMTDRTVDELTSIVVRDVTVGAQGTTIRSGIIGEVGINGNPLVENELKSIRASARAARLTGAPMLLHSFAPPAEMMQALDIIASEGVDLTRVVMGHSGRDISATKQFFDRGVFIEWDYMGQSNQMTPERAEQIATTIASAINAGFADKVLVAHDVCTKAQLKRNGGGGYTYIATMLVPALKAKGISDETIRTILIDNPRRALTFVAPQRAVATPYSSAQEPQLGGGKPIFPSNQGGPNFQRHCASCHTADGLNIGGRVVPSVATLRTLTAEQVYSAISAGSMAQQASSLSDPQRRELAGFVSGKRFADTSGYAVEKMPNRCSTNPTLGDLAAAPAWNGWSPAPDNRRFQPAAAAGITAADVPKLTLKWAFGLPGAASAVSQPTVALGRVFVGSDNGFLYSLDARTGCGHWSFRPEGGGDAAGPYAPMVGPISGYDGTKYAVYIVARGLTVFAVDAQTGKELWRTRIDGGGGMRGSATLADGRIYVPITGSETMVGANGTCCRTRGALVSIDASNGRIVWRADTIQEPLAQVGTKKDGTPVMGPSGASVWNAPTVDLKRRRVYIGTGNSFGPVAASTSDSIIAFNIDDGKIVWHHQEFKGDAFMLNCPDKNPDGGNCPEVLGPDWDFGGSSVIMQALPNGRDVLLAAGKGGVAIALNADDGKLLWRTKLYETTPPTADGLVLFGGTSDGTRVYYPLQQPKGGLATIQIANGRLDWTVKLDADGRGQFGGASAIPGIVFTGAWDGVLRAIDANGKTVWRHNSRQPYKTVNGVFADGGSFGSTGPTIAGGMVYAVSGYIGMQAGSPGNVLLAFGLDQ